MKFEANTEVLKTDNIRRKIIQAGWTTPIVASISLPTHAQTSSAPSCMASASTNSIFLVNGGGILAVPVIFTVENTSDIMLNSQPGTGFTNVDPSFGALGSSGSGSGINSDLAPGEMATFTLTSLTVTNCDTSGTIDWRFRYFEVNCSITLNVSCSSNT